MASIGSSSKSVLNLHHWNQIIFKQNLIGGEQKHNLVTDQEEIQTQQLWQQLANGL